MNQDQSRTNAERRELDGFERNRFFHGKLMTARDMLAEQNYHADRLHTLTRLVTGSGIVTGLDVTVSEPNEGEIEITVDPGFALDRAGRPIVVDERATSTFKSPSRNEIHVFLNYDEATKGSVPVPGSQNAYGEECTYNRIVETFEITYQETDDLDPGKTVPPVEFPSKDEVDAADLVPDDPALVDLARSYVEDLDSIDHSGDRQRVYVGSFERGSDGSWRQMTGEEGLARPHVYTNDMLYAAIVRHVTDFENPHQVSAEQASEETFEDLQSDLDRLRSEVEELKTRSDGPSEAGLSLERYLLEKKVGAFQVVATRFEGTAAGEIATEIVDRTREAIDDDRFDTEEYREFVAEIAEVEHELATILQDRDESGVTADNRREYVAALNELVAALEEDENAYQVAVAQDRVCETARRLKDIVDVQGGGDVRDM